MYVFEEVIEIAILVICAAIGVVLVGGAIWYLLRAPIFVNVRTDSRTNQYANTGKVLAMFGFYAFMAVFIAGGIVSALMAKSHDDLLGSLEATGCLTAIVILYISWSIYANKKWSVPPELQVWQ